MTRIIEVPFVLSNVITITATEVVLFGSTCRLLLFEVIGFAQVFSDKVLPQVLLCRTRGQHGKH